MATRCSVCNHGAISTINKLLVQGVACREIARRYNLTASSVSRHRKNHLISMPPPNADADKQPANPFGVGNAAEQLEQLKQISQKLLASVTASETVPFNTVIAIMKEIRAQVGDIEKIQLKSGSPKLDSLESNPEWLTFRKTVLDALFDYPAAKGAVIEALGPQN